MTLQRLPKEMRTKTAGNNNNNHKMPKCYVMWPKWHTCHGWSICPPRPRPSMPSKP